MLAALENIFPPVPADSAVALGAFLAGQGGSVTMAGVFFATWVPNVASAIGTYWVARTVGRTFAESPAGRRLLHPRAIRAIERAYQRHHIWGIFVSRFLPGYRAVVPPFAGIAGIGALRALAPVVVASGIWYGFLVWLAHRVGQDWDTVGSALQHLTWWLAGAALAVTAVLAWAALRWRRRHLRREA